MDCSWLVDDSEVFGCNEDTGSESDSEEVKAELESRLYSIIHHSDLNQPLPPELAKHYSIECGEGGKLTVALQNPLETIKLEEIKNVDQLNNDIACESDDSDVVEIDSTHEKGNELFFDQFSSGQKSFKRLRYSDVDIDALHEPVKKNVSSFIGENTYERICSDDDFSNLNYFNVPSNFYKKKKMRKLKYLTVPNSFTFGKNPNWKDSSNESYIPVFETKEGNRNNVIIDQMVNALKTANPKEKNKFKLFSLARALYSCNYTKKMQKIKKKCKKSKRNVERHSVCDDISLKEDVLELNEQRSEDNEQPKIRKNKATNVFDGSISLNISPFKPLHPTVDLISEDEDDDTNIVGKECRNWTSLPPSELPTKWTMKMIRFYTKPSQTKMNMELSQIFDDLENNSTVDDWRLDPRDEMGSYHQKVPKGKHKNRKCPNCNQRGHLMHECPMPRKIPTCYLCGLNYHSAYSCPNRICLKCGVPLMNEAYECASCYQSTFNYDIPCGVCGRVTHRTEICPDSWRSFHATVDGEKKMPKQIKENKRKYCCNCATKGHFSHECPFPSCDGEQLSSFVKNYSASSSESGTTEVVVPHYLTYIFETKDADNFLQKLSNSTNAVINVEEGPINYVFQISGNFSQCSKVKGEIEAYINTRKRKRQDSSPVKKRRRF